MLGSCPVDKCQGMLLIHLPRKMGVNFPSRKGPLMFTRSRSYGLFRNMTAFSNRHQLVKSFNRRINDTLSMSHTSSPSVRKTRNILQMTNITVRIFLRRQNKPTSASECAPRHSFQQLCCLYLHLYSRSIRQRRGNDRQKMTSGNTQQERMTEPLDAILNDNDTQLTRMHYRTISMSIIRCSSPWGADSTMYLLGTIHRREGATQPTTKRASVILYREPRSLSGKITS